MVAPLEIANIVFEKCVWDLAKKCEVEGEIPMPALPVQDGPKEWRLVRGRPYAVIANWTAYRSYLVAVRSDGHAFYVASNPLTEDVVNGDRAVLVRRVVDEFKLMADRLQEFLGCACGSAGGHRDAASGQWIARQVWCELHKPQG